MMALKPLSYSNIRPRIKLRSEIMVALFALSQSVYINFVGRLMLSELIALVGILFINKTRIFRVSRPYLRSILFGYCLFLFALIISDLYNNSSSNDYLRGWAAVIFGIVSTLFLVDQFYKSSRSIYIYLIVSGISAVFMTQGGVNLEGLEVSSNYFKVKFVPIILPTLVVLSALLWSYKRFLSVCLLFFGGAIFMLFDARSSGAGLIIASLLLFVQMYKFKPKLSHSFLIILLIGLISYGGYIYYVNQVLYHGVGGANAQQLLNLDNPYNPAELILEGRSSVVIAAKAIADRPLLGFGSWAKDPTGEYGLIYASLHDNMDNFRHKLGIIPVHSVILAAWVWGGIIGFYGMGMVGITMLRLFLVSFWSNLSLAPILNVYFVATFWGFLFSPIGSIRTTFPFIIALLIIGSYCSLMPNNKENLK